MKNMWVRLFYFTFLTFGMLSCSSAPDDWLVKVDDKYITDRWVNGVIEIQFASGRGATLDTLQYKHYLVSRTINRILLGKYAKSLELSPDEIRVQSAIDRSVSSFDGESEFLGYLTKLGLTYEDWKDEIWQEFAADELINQKINMITTPDSLILDSLKQNMKTELIRVSHILRKITDSDSDEKKRQEINRLIEIKRLAENKGGKEFAALARKFSEGPSASDGGDLDFFSKGTMVKPFEDAAFALDIGQISDVVQTQFGYHLIYMTDKKTEIPADADIQQQAVMLTRKQAYDQLIKMLNELYDIEISSRLKETGFSY